jgi:hypothetical protein
MVFHLLCTVGRALGTELFTNANYEKIHCTWQQILVEEKKNRIQKSGVNF